MSYNPPPQPPQGQPQGQPQWQGQPQGPPQGQPPQQWQGQPQGQPPNMPPPPAGYGYGGRPQVPAQVTTASVLLFIMGGLAILGGLLLFAISSLGAIFAVFAVLYLVAGGVAIWSGVALRQLKERAREVALGLSGLVAILSLISIFKGGFLGIVDLIMAGVVIYMLVQKPVVETFNRARR